MTARLSLTQAALDRAAKVAKATGVTVTITARDGTVYTIAPAGVAIADDHGLADYETDRIAARSRACLVKCRRSAPMRSMGYGVTVKRL